MEYDFAQGVSLAKMKVAACAMMQDGWLPTGGPEWNERGLLWIQAMYRVGRATQNGDVKIREVEREKR